MFKAEFGDVGPGSVTIANWWLLSEDIGILNKYAANFISANGQGDEVLSIVDNLEVHELVRNVRLHDGKEEKYLCEWQLFK